METLDISRANPRAGSGTFGMPGRRRSIGIVLDRTAARSTQPLKPAAIENERARLIVEMSRLRREHGSSAQPMDTAQTLLTRWWVTANWRAREKLVKSAEWLVRLERSRCMQSPQP